MGDWSPKQKGWRLEPSGNWVRTDSEGRTYLVSSKLTHYAELMELRDRREDAACPTWTTHPPTERGEYWARFSETAEAQPVEWCPGGYDGDEEPFGSVYIMASEVAHHVPYEGKLWWGPKLKPPGGGQ